MAGWNPFASSILFHTEKKLIIEKQKPVPKESVLQFVSKDKFTVQIEGDIDPLKVGMECTGIAFANGNAIKVDTDLIYSGGEEDQSYFTLSHINYGDLVISKSTSQSEFFTNWIMDNTGLHNTILYDITIKKYGLDHKVVSSITLHRAFPVSWEIGELNSNSMSQVLFEKVQLTYNYLTANKI